MDPSQSVPGTGGGRLDGTQRHGAIVPRPLAEPALPPRCWLTANSLTARRLVAPGRADVAEHGGHIGVAEHRRVRRHAEGPRIAGGGRRESRRRAPPGPDWPSPAGSLRGCPPAPDRHRARLRPASPWHCAQCSLIDLRAPLGRRRADRHWRLRSPWPAPAACGKLLRNTAMARRSAGAQVLRALQHHLGHRPEHGAARRHAGLQQPHRFAPGPSRPRPLRRAKPARAHTSSASGSGRRTGPSCRCSRPSHCASCGRRRNGPGPRTR